MLLSIAGFYRSGDVGENRSAGPPQHFAELASVAA